MNKKELTHISSESQPQMVDVGQKNTTYRLAKAQSIVFLGSEIMNLLKDGEIQSKKGAVFQTAIIAGTMAVKKTSDLIPFCHPIAIEKCKIKIKAIENEEVLIECQVGLHAKTGVEMEALTGASVAALTIYDMCKAISHDIVIKETRLLEKSGGKSDFSIQK